jgi:hypothetical protein
MVLAVTLLGATMQLYFPEGLVGLGWSLLFAGRSETRFAPGYSWSAFRHVRVGMTRDEVRSLLGQPLRVQTARYDTLYYENWVYSESPVSRSYHARTVIFDANGRVAQRVAEFYVD